MESAPENKENNVEDFSGYDEKRTAGHERAQAMIDERVDLKKADYREQYAALFELLEELAGEENAYYESEYVAAKMREIEVRQEMFKLDTELEQIRNFYNTPQPFAEAS